MINFWAPKMFSMERV